MQKIEKLIFNKCSKIVKVCAITPVVISFLSTDLLSEQLKYRWVLNKTLKSLSISNKKTVTFTVSYGSSIFCGHNIPSDIIYALSDRGINIDCKHDVEILGKDICKKGKIFPMKSYGPHIYKIKIGYPPFNYIKVLKSISIKESNGAEVSPLPNTTSDDIPYDINGEKLLYDPNGIDTEALVKTSNGDFWVAEEYAPSIIHLDKFGNIIKRYVPSGYEKNLKGTNYPVIGILPSILRKRHRNRGIESLAISPDEKTLYFAMQSPLDNPNKYIAKKSRFIRLFAMQIDNPLDIKEYIYALDPVESYSKDNVHKQFQIKVSEMRCISKGILLILEHSKNIVRIYEVNLNKALPLNKKYDSLAVSPTIEELGVNKKNTSIIFDSILPKKLYFTTEHKKGIFSKKIEGFCLSKKYLFLINDNDFGIKNKTTIIQAFSLPN